MSPDVRALVRKLRKAGVTVEHRRSGHLMAYWPSVPDKRVTFPSTPSAYSSMPNALADIRRQLGIGIR